MSAAGGSVTKPSLRLQTHVGLSEEQEKWQLEGRWREEAEIHAAGWWSVQLLDMSRWTQCWGTTQVRICEIRRSGKLNVWITGVHEEGKNGKRRWKKWRERELRWGSTSRCLCWGRSGSHVGQGRASSLHCIHIGICTERLLSFCCWKWPNSWNRRSRLSYEPHQNNSRLKNFPSQSECPDVSSM